MKTVFWCVAAVIVVGLGSCVLSQRRNSHENPNPEIVRDSGQTVFVHDGDSEDKGRNTPNRDTTGIPAKTRREPTIIELELLGRVPDGANERTWLLCEKTSWWGNRLDPDVFWSNRVVWIDSDIESEAHSRGRLYPPLPSGDSHFLDRSDKDEGGRPLQTWEIRCRAYRHSERERVFWDWFSKTHPRPPEQIEQALGRAFEELTTIQSIGTSYPSGLTIPPPSQKEEERILADEYEKRGFPREAFSPEVLKWEYVFRKRREFQRLLDQDESPEIEIMSSRFKKNLNCPFHFIEAPPSDEEIRVTTGWRVAYLRRLRREGTDESYIEAYKKAWNLSEEELKEETE